MGVFTLHHRRNGKVTKYRCKNQQTTAGKLALVNACFINPGAATIGPWYYGLISNKNFTALDESDTMLSHPGWEEMVGYDSATRKLISTWFEIGAFGGPTQSRGLTGKVAFYQFTRGIGGIQGMFLTTDPEKGGTVGTLYNMSIAQNNQVDPPLTFFTVAPGDEVFLEYGVSVSTTPVTETP